MFIVLVVLAVLATAGSANAQTSLVRRQLLAAPQS